MRIPRPSLSFKDMNSLATHRLEEQRKSTRARGSSQRIFSSTPSYKIPMDALSKSRGCFIKLLGYLALLVITPIPSVLAAASPTLIAYWDFNTTPSAGIVVDSVRGITGTLMGKAALTPDSGGHSGQPGDRAVDFTDNPGLSYVQMDGGFLSFAAPFDQVTFSFWQKLYSIHDAAAFWANSPSSPPDSRGAAVHVPWS